MSLSRCIFGTYGIEFQKEAWSFMDYELGIFSSNDFRLPSWRIAS